jgi:hypothetical protein
MIGQHNHANDQIGIRQVKMHFSPWALNVREGDHLVWEGLSRAIRI